MNPEIQPTSPPDLAGVAVATFFSPRARLEGSSTRSPQGPATGALHELGHTPQSSWKSLRSRPSEPRQSFGYFIWYALALFVHDSYVTLCAGTSSVGCLSEPHRCFLVALRHPPALEVRVAQVALCAGMTLAGRLSIPPCRSGASLGPGRTWFPGCTERRHFPGRPPFTTPRPPCRSETPLAPVCTWRPGYTTRWHFLGRLPCATTPWPPCRAEVPLGPGHERRPG